MYTFISPYSQQSTRPRFWCRLHRCRAAATLRCPGGRCQGHVVRPAAQRLTRAEVAFHQEVAEAAIDAWFFCIKK